MPAKKVILLVDDDGDDREFFCEVINDINADINCLVAFNCEEALEKLRNALIVLPDIIFLDLNMPKMDGKTCLQELKKDARLKHIPVIIFTTSSAQRDKEHMRVLGAEYFVTKPAKFEDLRDRILFVLDKKYMGQSW